jgi:hypothetical protein
MKTAMLGGLFLTLSACTLPQTTVHSGSAKPSLSVSGAPADAVLYVDGLSIGPAAQYDGHPKTLAVLEGAHQVLVREGSRELYSEKIFVSSGELRTIVILPGATP